MGQKIKIKSGSKTLVQIFYSSCYDIIYPKKKISLSLSSPVPSPIDTFQKFIFFFLFFRPNITLTTAKYLLFQTTNRIPNAKKKKKKKKEKNLPAPLHIRAKYIYIYTNFNRSIDVKADDAVYMLVCMYNTIQR